MTTANMVFVLINTTSVLIARVPHIHSPCFIGCDVMMLVVVGPAGPEIVKLDHLSVGLSGLQSSDEMHLALKSLSEPEHVLFGQEKKENGPTTYRRVQRHATHGFYSSIQGPGFRGLYAQLFLFGGSFFWDLQCTASAAEGSP